MVLPCTVRNTRWLAISSLSSHWTKQAKKFFYSVPPSPGSTSVQSPFRRHFWVSMVSSLRKRAESVCFRITPLLGPSSTVSLQQLPPLLRPPKETSPSCSQWIDPGTLNRARGTLCHLSGESDMLGTVFLLGASEGSSGGLVSSSLLQRGLRFTYTGPERGEESPDNCGACIFHAIMFQRRTRSRSPVTIKLRFPSHLKYPVAVGHLGMMVGHPQTGLNKNLHPWIGVGGAFIDLLTWSLEHFFFFFIESCYFGGGLQGVLSI